jgi:hypothetical protein
MLPNADQSVSVGNTYKVTKTFELTYPNLPEGATVWVEYSLDGGEPQLQQLQPVRQDVYGFQLDVPYNTVIEGRWVVAYMGEIVTIAEFGPEVLTEDLLNEFDFDPSITGMKFSDDNGDGVRGQGEAGLEGWTINLYRLVPAVPDNVEGPVATEIPLTWEFVGSTTTGPDGSYSFVGLPPGTYKVEEVMQDGWTQTAAPTVFVMTGENQVIPGLDFGNTQFLPFSDTTIVKSADKTKAEPGDIVTYTLTYKNIGDETLETVTITDDYDERYMTPVDVGDGVVADGKITWERTDLAPDEERSITYTMKVSEDMPEGTTLIDNTAVIDPFGDSDSWRVTVEVEEDFLPFTGGGITLLVFGFLAALAAGLTLRRLARAAQS